MANAWKSRMGVGASFGLVSIFVASQAFGEWEKGMTAIQAGQFEDAVREFREVVETHPDYAAGYYMLGSAQRSLDQSSEAIASLRRAVDLDGSSATYAFSLAQAYLSKGQPDRTLEAMEAHSPKALPERMRSRFAKTLGAAVIASDQPEVAIPQLERALAVLPGEAPLWVGLGKAKGEAADLQGSFSAYNKAFEIDPSNTTTGRLAVQQAWSVAETLGEAGRSEWFLKAAGVAETLATNEPSAVFASLAGDSFLHGGEPSSARKWLEVAQGKDSSNPAIAFSLAKVSLALNEDQRALRELEQASQKVKQDQNSQLFKQIARAQGFAYHKAGQYRLAAEAYRRCGDEAKALEMADYQDVAASNGEIERKRQECLAKKKLVDRDKKEMEAKKGLFSVEEWLKIEGKFARQLVECQPYLDTDEAS